MKSNYITLCLIVLFITSCDTTTPTTKTTQNWIPQQSGTTKGLADVFFEDAQKGYVVGDSGTLVHTTDGGTTWTTVPLPINNPLSGYIVDNGIHYLVGADYAARGNSVHSLVPTLIESRSKIGGMGLFILKASNKLCCFGGCFAFNSAVGKSLMWDDQNLIWKAPQKNDSYIGSPGRPIVGSDGSILLPTYLSMNLGHAPNVVFKIDPDTWRMDTVWQSGDIIGITSLGRSSSHIIGVGRDKIIVSTNNGSTWSQQGTPSGAELNDVVVLSSTLAYACGNRGVILKSNDGGLTWSTMESGTTQDLYRMVFTDGNTGYIVGGGGTILKLSIDAN